MTAAIFVYSFIALAVGAILGYVLRRQDPLPELSDSHFEALPQDVRRYLHALETRTDPAGDVRRAFAAELNASALVARVRELERELDVARNRMARWAELMTEHVKEKERLDNELAVRQQALELLMGPDGDQHVDRFVNGVKQTGIVKGVPS